PPWQYTRANLPLLGLNSPARTVSGALARYVPTRRAVPVRQPQKPTPAASEPRDDPEALRIARRLQSVMRTQALVSGQVARIGATGALVRVQQGGRSVTARYPLTDVYRFQGDQILDAASAPDGLRPGDSVMVPERPEADR